MVWYWCRPNKSPGFCKLELECDEVQSDELGVCHQPPDNAPLIMHHHYHHYYYCYCYYIAYISSAAVHASNSFMLEVLAGRRQLNNLQSYILLGGCLVQILRRENVRYDDQVQHEQLPIHRRMKCIRKCGEDFKYCRKSLNAICKCIATSFWPLSIRT